MACCGKSLAMQLTNKPSITSKLVYPFEGRIRDYKLVGGGVGLEMIIGGMNVSDRRGCKEILFWDVVIHL